MVSYRLSLIRWMLYRMVFDGFASRFEVSRGLVTVVLKLCVKLSSPMVTAAQVP